jgi:hypothetical protein
VTGLQAVCGLGTPLSQARSRRRNLAEAKGFEGMTTFEVTFPDPRGHRIRLAA